jgi:hypothetical protein
MKLIMKKDWLGVVLLVTVTAAEVRVGWESAKNCTATCVGLPYAAVPSEEHVPEGNNNHYTARVTSVSYAGSGNNNTSL